MSEGIFTLPRNADDGVLKRSSQTTAFGTAAVSISAKAGRVYRVRFNNKSSTTYFAQIHDKATAAVATNVPIWEGVLPASGTVELDFGTSGLYVTLGLSIAISTTAGVLTMAAATDATAYVHYTTAG